MTYEQERPFDYPGSSQGEVDNPFMECEACQNEEDRENEGEWVVDHTHRIEGRAVAQDWVWICAACRTRAEEGR